MVVKIMFIETVPVRSVGHSGDVGTRGAITLVNFAVMKDTNYPREGGVCSDMGAARSDVLTKSRRKEFAINVAQSAKSSIPACLP